MTNCAPRGNPKGETERSSIVLARATAAEQKSKVQKGGDRQERKPPQSTSSTKEARPRVDEFAQRRSEGQSRRRAIKYLAKKAREESQRKDHPGDELSNLSFRNGARHGKTSASGRNERGERDPGRVDGKAVES
jgi:sRNA-binding protein